MLIKKILLSFLLISSFLKSIPADEDLLNQINQVFIDEQILHPEEKDILAPALQIIKDCRGVTVCEVKATLTFEMAKSFLKQIVITNDALINNGKNILKKNILKWLPLIRVQYILCDILNQQAKTALAHVETSLEAKEEFADFFDRFKTVARHKPAFQTNEYFKSIFEMDHDTFLSKLKNNLTFLIEQSSAFTKYFEEQKSPLMFFEEIQDSPKIRRYQGEAVIFRGCEAKSNDVILSTKDKYSIKKVTDNAESLLMAMPFLNKTDRNIEPFIKMLEDSFDEMFKNTELAFSCNYKEMRAVTKETIYLFHAFKSINNSRLSTKIAMAALASIKAEEAAVNQSTNQVEKVVDEKVLDFSALRKKQVDRSSLENPCAEILAHLKRFLDYRNQNQNQNHKSATFFAGSIDIVGIEESIECDLEDKFELANKVFAETEKLIKEYPSLTIQEHQTKIASKIFYFMNVLLFLVVEMSLFLSANLSHIMSCPGLLNTEDLMSYLASVPLKKYQHFVLPKMDIFEVDLSDINSRTEKEVFVNTEKYLPSFANTIKIRFDFEQNFIEKLNNLTEHSSHLIWNAFYDNLEEEAFNALFELIQVKTYVLFANNHHGQIYQQPESSAEKSNLVNQKMPKKKKRYKK